VELKHEFRKKSFSSKETFSPFLNYFTARFNLSIVHRNKYKAFLNPKVDAWVLLLWLCIGVKTWFKGLLSADQKVWTTKKRGLFFIEH
jgi:hypothetical protein